MLGMSNAVDRRERIEPVLFRGQSAIQNTDAPLTWEQAARLAGWITPTFAGRDVTPESAMRISAVFACVRVIAGVIAALPFPVYKMQADGDRERVRNQPIDWLLNNEPCPGMTAAIFWKYMVTSQLLSGDMMAWIERDRNGNALNLWPLNPRTSSVMRDPDSGGLIYRAINWKGQMTAYSEDDVLHVPGEGFDGLRGKSVIGWAARQGVGIAIAAEEYAGRFFANGARPDIVLKYPGKMKADQAKDLMNYWLGKHQGLESSHLPALVTEGGDIQEIGLNPSDTQLLETRKYQVIDIARAFGVPPILIGESEKTSSWGAGVEQVLLGFVKFTIKPMLATMEQEANKKLLTTKVNRTQNYFAEWNLDGLLRGDSKTQVEFTRGMVGGSAGPGVMTVNEARRVFNLPKMADGDKLFTFPTQSGGSNDPLPASK